MVGPRPISDREPGHLLWVTASVNLGPHSPANQATAAPIRPGRRRAGRGPRRLLDHGEVAGHEIDLHGHDAKARRRCRRRPRAWPGPPPRREVDPQLGHRALEPEGPAERDVGPLGTRVVAARTASTLRCWSAAWDSSRSRLAHAADQVVSTSSPTASSASGSSSARAAVRSAAKAISAASVVDLRPAGGRAGGSRLPGLAGRRPR